MKLEPRRVEAFLKDPGPTRAVLLYGDDVGQIAERALQLVACVAGSAGDPFRVVELGRESRDQLAAEAASLSLTGGRRVVRVRDATDAWVGEVEATLAGAGTALVVLEGAGLPSRSRLRALLERAPDGAAIGCHAVAGAQLGRDIRGTLQQHGIACDAATVEWLQAHLGADLAATRAELEKLVLFIGPGGTADLAAVAACVGDLAGMSLDDALFAATAGEVAQADRALAVALAEGATPVGVLRAALLHVQRLHRARLLVDAGTSATEAAKAMRPPLFFRREPAFMVALRLWPEARLVAAAAGLWRDENACKRTAAPAEAVCRHAVLGLALRAAQVRRP